MKQTKYINSEGLAFSENDDMKKLGEYTKEGWIFESITPFGYKLRKKEPQNITYTLDYQKAVDEEYFSFFEEAGWTHVCSGTNQMHFFSAPEGTNPIHTEKMTSIEKYETARESMGKIALPTLIITCVLFLIPILSGTNKIPETIGSLSGIFGYVSLIILIFTGLPYIGYSVKLRKLRRGGSQMSENKDSKKTSYLVVGMVVGLPLGVALGLTIMDNLALGAGIGLMLGIVIGAVVDSSIKANKD